MADRAPGEFLRKKERGLPNGKFFCEFCGTKIAEGEIKHIKIKCRKCNKFNGFECI